MSIVIDVLDIADNATHYYITRDLRKGLRVDNNIPGGNDVATWQIPCALASEWMSTHGKWPSLGSRVTIYDGSTATWQGRWNRPKVQVVKRALKAVSCGAQGYMHSMTDDSMKTRVVYGKGVTGIQLGDDKRNITDITEGVANAVGALCPFITVPGITPCGINVQMDTQAFAGNNAQDIVNFFAALTSSLGTPFIWYVVPGPGDLPSFYFEALDVSTYYLDDGLQEWDSEYELEKVVNTATVEWGNNQRWTEPDPEVLTGPLAYHLVGGTDIRRRKYMNAAEQYTGYDDIKALAGGYLNRFNKLVGSGTYLVKGGPINTIGPGLEELHEIMPGHTILLKLPPDYPEPTDEARYVTHTSWDEDACVTTLTMQNPATIGEEMRRLAAAPEHQKFIMAMSFGDVPQSTRLNEAPPLGTTYPGTEYDDVGGHVVVRTVQPIAAMTTTGASDPAKNKEFGELGGQMLPGILPDNFSEILQQFRSANGTTALPVDAVNAISIIPITKDYKGLTNWSIATTTAGAITIVIKKNGVTVATLTQAAGTHTSGTVGIFDLEAGDVLTYFITANAGGIANAAATIAADKKHWPAFPTAYPAPPAVP